MTESFGEFFKRLRRRSEQRGSTDTQCGDMDDFRYKRSTEPSGEFGVPDRAWARLTNQELSHTNLLEFSTEMTEAGVKRLIDRVNHEVFNPYRFTLSIDSVHEFHHAMLDVARECGLDVQNLVDWQNAMKERQAAA